MTSACANPHTQTIDRIEVEHDASGNGDGRFISLPLHVQAKRESNDIYWYRIPTEQYAHLQRPAILVSRAGANFQIHLDDEWAFGGSFTASPMKNTWNIPFLIPLSKLQLTNSTYIRVAIYALAGNHVTLEPLFVDEYEKLTLRYTLTKLFQVDITFAITIGALCLALVSLFLWIASRGEKQYLFGALTAFTLICANFNFFVTQPPVDQKIWQVLAHTSLDWFGVFVVLWMAVLHGIKHPLLRWLWIWGAASTVVNIALPIKYILPTVELLHIVSIALFVSVFILANRIGNADELEKRLIVVTGIIGTLFCVFDLLIQFGVVYVTGAPRAVPFMFFSLLLANHISLLRRFVHTYRAARRSNEELAEVVARKEQELNKQFHQLAHLKAQQARTTERQHIFREIHDGMGGHLVSAMALTRKDPNNEALLAALKSAHDDMRLLIDGGAFGGSDIGETLGQLRPRLQPIVESANMRLHWNIDVSAQTPELSIQQRMHIVRIIQECVTNVIKHANATAISIAKKVTDDCITIVVSDDGTGLSDDTDRFNAGNGLVNMRQRAAEIGGTFSLTSGDKGAIATLKIKPEALIAAEGELARHYP